VERKEHAPPMFRRRGVSSRRGRDDEGHGLLASRSEGQPVIPERKLGRPYRGQDCFRERPTLEVDCGRLPQARLGAQFEPVAGVGVDPEPGPIPDALRKSQPNLGHPSVPRDGDRFQSAPPQVQPPGSQRVGGIPEPLHRRPQGLKHRQHSRPWGPVPSLLAIGIGELDVVESRQLSEQGRLSRLQRSPSTRWRMPWIGILTQSGRLLISYRSS
jgi:hypothetical protein